MNKKIQALNTIDRNVQKKTIEELAALGESIIDPLIAVSRQKNENQGNGIEETLSRIGTPAVPKLLRELSEGNQYSKIIAIHALENIQDKRAIQPLINLAGNPYWKIRKAAQKALQRFGVLSESAIQDTLLDSELDSRVRGELLYVLSEMGALQEDNLVETLLYTSDVNTQILAAEKLEHVETKKSFTALDYALQKADHPDVITTIKKTLAILSQKGITLSLDEQKNRNLFTFWQHIEDWFAKAVKYFREIGFFQEWSQLSDTELVDTIKKQQKALYFRSPQHELNSNFDLLLILACDKNRVWWHDLEADVAMCNQVYIQTLKELSQISCGYFIPENISETWASMNGPIHITFEYQGQSISINPKYLSDYIDLETLLLKINELIEDTEIHFRACPSFDQSAYILSLTTKQKLRLQKDLDWIFH